MTTSSRCGRVKLHHSCICMTIVSAHVKNATSNKRVTKQCGIRTSASDHSALGASPLHLTSTFTRLKFPAHVDILHVANADSDLLLAARSTENTAQGGDIELGGADVRRHTVQPILRAHPPTAKGSARHPNRTPSRLREARSPFAAKLHPPLSGILQLASW